LNQRLQWELNNSIRELRFVFLNRDLLKLMIFIDAAFVNTIDLHSQIDYVICLIDDFHVNLIHWSSIMCKRVIKSIIERMLHIFLSLILIINSKFLYDCLVKLNTIAKKRLMIDLMCLRQSYKRREIAEIRWIDENINSADVMTKFKFCNVLISLIDTNFLNLKITEWIERWFNLDEIKRTFLTRQIDKNISDKNILMR
jgi:hypothetical protein